MKVDGELDDTLGYSKYDYKNKDTVNSRNGYSKKTMHTSYGDMDLDIPRDRNGEYEPQVIKKYQNTSYSRYGRKNHFYVCQRYDNGDIESHLNDLYGINVSDSTTSRVTDKILPIVKEWQERPLEDIYAVVYLDAAIFHVRSEGRIIKKAVYIALGLDLNGKRDVLGMYVGEK